MRTRFDNVGMWWEDFAPPPKVAGVRSERAVRHVALPDTGWTPPRDFPNLSTVRAIGLDTETKDLELLTRGPGAVRGAAHVVGVSVATEDAAWYFPLRHEYSGQRELNMDAEKVFAWLSDTLSRPSLSVIGANLLYDLEALRAEGVVRPAGKLHDVQLAEPLLDEEARTYSLDALARKYLGTGKETPTLYQWCADSFGGVADSTQRANIWRAPPTLVGPYAEADAQLPLRVFREQLKMLQAEDLFSLYRVECGLIPLLLDMRFRGVRVDVARAESALAWLQGHAATAQALIPGVDVWANASVARAFDKAGVEYPRTEAGNPSFTREWLEGQEHEIAKAVAEVRMYEKARNPFIQSYILDSHHNGRLHCQFHPLRSDTYGTVSGRFSSSNPNLQNIPSRHPVIGPLLRGLFVPEEGCVWRRADYSQIEYRMLAHFAIGKNSDMLRERYSADPTTDFHVMTMELVQEKTGVELGRKPAKNLNFGLVYGMSQEKTTRSLGVSEDLGTRLYDAYHKAIPAVKATYKSAERLAKRRGYIRTILGRRRRFTKTEKSRFSDAEQVAGTHKALNACLQGSAADIMKKGMHDCYHAGLFAEDACGIPHVTVHDELGWSDTQTAAAAEAFRETERVMTTCVKTRVPLLLDMSTGANWGECK